MTTDVAPKRLVTHGATLDGVSRLWLITLGVSLAGCSITEPSVETVWLRDCQPKTSFARYELVRGCVAGGSEKHDCELMARHALCPIRLYVCGASGAHQECFECRPVMALPEEQAACERELDRAASPL